MTQISASRASRIWLAVRSISPANIEIWFDISIVENAMPKMRPIYFARSPSRILSATRFMRALRGENRGNGFPAELSNVAAPCGLGSDDHNVYAVIMGID